MDARTFGQCGCEDIGLFGTSAREKKLDQIYARKKNGEAPSNPWKVGLKYGPEFRTTFYQKKLRRNPAPENKMVKDEQNTFSYVLGMRGTITVCHDEI